MEALRLPVAGQVQMAEPHRPALLDDGGGLAPHGLDPVGELLGVGHRGRQADQVDPRVEVDDHLLPHRAPVGVLEVVDLVEDDVAQPLEGGRGAVDHVAQHLGGHHHHRRLAVDGVVAGEKPDPARSVGPDEVAVLLVGQGLERRRVERLASLRQRPLDGIFGHHRLARTGGGGHQHGTPGVEGVESLVLEGVEREAAGHFEGTAPFVAGGERQRGHRDPSPSSPTPGTGRGSRPARSKPERG
jgi:hypothetical protein